MSACKIIPLLLLDYILYVWLHIIYLTGIDNGAHHFSHKTSALTTNLKICGLLPDWIIIILWDALPHFMSRVNYRSTPLQIVKQAVLFVLVLVVCHNYLFLQGMSQLDLKSKYFLSALLVCAYVLRFNFCVINRTNKFEIININLRMIHKASFAVFCFLSIKL